jgi:hypothetical protein
MAISRRQLVFAVFALAPAAGLACRFDPSGIPLCCAAEVFAGCFQHPELTAVDLRLVNTDKELLTGLLRIGRPPGGRQFILEGQAVNFGLARVTGTVADATTDPQSIVLLRAASEPDSSLITSIVVQIESEAPLGPLVRGCPSEI